MANGRYLKTSNVLKAVGAFVVFAGITCVLVLLLLTVLKNTGREDVCLKDVKQLIHSANRDPAGAAQKYSEVRLVLQRCAAPRQAEGYFLETSNAKDIASFKEWSATVCYIASRGNERALHIVDSYIIVQFGGEEMSLSEWLVHRSGRYERSKLWKVWSQHQDTLEPAVLKDGTVILVASEPQ